MKKLLLLLAVCLTMTLVACTVTDTTDMNIESTGTAVSDVTSDPTDDSAETTKPAEIGDTARPDSTGSKVEINEPPEEETPSSQASVAPESDKPAVTQPPATSQQADPPTPTTLTPNMPAPTQPNTPAPTSPPAPTDPPKPIEPVYTEADYQAIVDEIRAYGIGKGFIWEDAYTFEEGHQYYGRPNLERDGYNGVVSMLKYHCDKIEMYYGICYFKVVKHIYQGNTEFIVLYD